MPSPNWDNAAQRWILNDGDLAFWKAEDIACRVKIVLVTDSRVYVEATAADGPFKKGQVWYEGRTTRKLAPRAAVMVRSGRIASWPSKPVLILG